MMKEDEVFDKAAGEASTSSACEGTARDFTGDFYINQFEKFYAHQLIDDPLAGKWNGFLTIKDSRSRNVSFNEGERPKRQ